MKYASGFRSRRRTSLTLGILIVCLLVLAGLGYAGRQLYKRDLAAVSTDQRTQVVTIATGSTSKQIAAQLAAQHLIRSSLAFMLYAHLTGAGSKLQAGTYALAPSQNVQSIVATLSKGKVSSNLVTILPGKRLDQIRAELINDGYNPAAVDSALDPAQYADIPIVAARPATATSMEGLLFPDSFQTTAQTDPSAVVRESLKEMQSQLTPDLVASFNSEGLTPYQGITLASIVEMEVSKVADRPQVAQVFLTRLHSQATNGLLGSDITLIYSRTMSSINPGISYAAYDTTSHPGLPPGPIATVSADALQAVAHPAATHWLYFVSGDDGNTYFSTNLQDHQALTQKYCHKLCSQ